MNFVTTVSTESCLIAIEGLSLADLVVRRHDDVIENNCTFIGIGPF